MSAEFDPKGVIVSCPSCGTKNRLYYERLGQAVRCGQCKHELSAPTAPIDIADSAAFDRVVAQSALPVVVDYWAPWCGPCRMVAPELKKVAERRAGKILVVKVNTEALPDLGGRFDPHAGGIRQRTRSRTQRRRPPGPRNRGVHRSGRAQPPVTPARDQRFRAGLGQ
jgi:thioredoxin 2